MKAPTVGCSSWCWGGLFLADASSQEPLGPGWGRVSPEKACGGAGSVARRGAGRRRRSPGRRRMWVGVQIVVNQFGYNVGWCSDIRLWSTIFGILPQEEGEGSFPKSQVVAFSLLK